MSLFVCVQEVSQELLGFADLVEEAEHVEHLLPGVAGQQLLLELPEHLAARLHDRQVVLAYERAEQLRPGRGLAGARLRHGLHAAVQVPVEQVH